MPLLPFLVLFAKLESPSLFNCRCFNAADLLTTGNYEQQIKVIAILKHRLIQLLYVPAIQQDIAAVPDGLLLIDTPGSELFLIGGPVLSLNICPGFTNGVYVCRYCSHTQEKPPWPDEVDLDPRHDG